MHSYKEQVTKEHDAFCITAALQSALENRADNQDFNFTLADALEEAYVYLAEGMSGCRCRLAGLRGEARIAYLLQYSEDALAAMTGSGYWNDSTGERMTITAADYLAVYETRNERDANWLAETLANEVAGDPNSYSAVVTSDTMGDPRYSLQVNGAPSNHGAHVTKWGIAYAVCREMMAAGIDPDSNTGAISAVLDSRQDGSTVILGDLEFSVTFESEA